MDPHVRLRDLLAGAACTVCGRPLAVGRARVLARREELAFVELPCDGCGLAGLGIVSGPVDDPSIRPSVDGVSFGELGPIDEARLAGSAPVSAADVLAMHEFLASWRGDLRGPLGLDGRAGDGRSA